MLHFQKTLKIFEFVTARGPVSAHIFSISSQSFGLLETQNKLRQL